MTGRRRDEPAIDYLRRRSLLREKALRRRAEHDKSGFAGRAALVADRLIDEVHPKALHFLSSSHRQKAAKCTRRAGKTRGILRGLTSRAIRLPNSRHYYINETLGECERIAWIGNRRDGLLSLNEDYKLGGKPIEHKARIVFPNRATIEMIGADDKRAVNKLRGMAFDTLVVDEAQKMPHLEWLIFGVAQAAGIDFLGEIWLTGTPEEDCSGFFYDISKEEIDERLPGWEVHEFSVLDNPFFGDNEEQRFERAIKPIYELNGWTGEEPIAQREWQGRWIKEDANFVYWVHRVPKHKLIYGESWEERPRLTEEIDFEWHFILGVDIGYDPDPFAYVIWAWHDKDDCLYEVESFKEARLTADAQAEVLLELMTHYDFDIMVADAGGGGKLVVAGWIDGWHDRFPIPIAEAKKSQKFTYMEFLNNDIVALKMRFLKGSPLLEEMRHLTWMPRKGNALKREHKTKKLPSGKTLGNHCCDAALYGHREASHHRYGPEAPGVEYGTPGYWKKLEDEIERENLERIDEAFIDDPFAIQ